MRGLALATLFLGLCILSTGGNSTARANIGGAGYVIFVLTLTAVIAGV